MKNKIFCLALALMLLISASALAVAPEDFTMEKFAAANSHEALMERYSSYYSHIEYSNGISGTTYADAELFYSMIPGSAILYSDGRQGQMNEGAFTVDLYAGDQPNLEWTTCLVGYSPDEELVDVAQEGEKLIIKTRSSIPNYGEDLQGGHCEYTYEANAQDLSFLGGSYASYTPDGTILFQVSWVIEYDAQRPAQAQEMLDRMNPQENFRTVTVVLDPGTEDETVCAAKSIKGDIVDLYLGEAYTALYLDAECTQPFAGGSDPTQDITLYAVKAE